jgi:predicted GNAT family acetyltransferase
MSDVVVTDNPEQHRFEAHLDGELAGFALYALRPGAIVFVHTEVDPAFEGKGIGSSLVRQSLDQVRERGGLEVFPLCPFYKAWLGKHPEYDDLVNEEYREQR